MRKPGILIAVALTLAMLAASAARAVVLPDYTPLWPICVKPRKHQRIYGEQPCPCEAVYTVEIRSLCYFPKKHLKCWRKRGYCACVTVLTPAIRDACHNPRGHFKRWKKGGPCPCVGRWPPKDQTVHDGEG